MYIRNKIYELLSTLPNVYDDKYKLVLPKRWNEEFHQIKLFLLKNFDHSEIIGLRLRQDYLFTMTILACMDVGIPYVPLSHEWPDDRINQIKNLANLNSIISNEILEKIFNESNKENSSDVELKPLPSEPDDMLYCMFTSGSTGEPKGVVIQRKSYENFLRWIELELTDISSGQKLLNSTNYTFDVSLCEVGLFLIKKVDFYSSNANNPLSLMMELSQNEIEISVTVPNNYLAMLDKRFLDKFPLNSLKVLLLAGSRFPASLHQKLREFLPNSIVYNCYGPTEATIYCICKKLEMSSFDIYNDNVSIGTPILGCEALLWDSELSQPSQSGELLISGPQLLKEYLNRPEMTNEVLQEINGKVYYRTGDIAFVNNRMEYFITGRTDDTVKVSGQRVNLLDIDEYIYKLAYIKLASTIAIPDDLRGSKLVLYVVTSELIDKARIVKDLKSVLIGPQIPTQIHIVDELPISSSGKVDKKKLAILNETLK